MNDISQFGTVMLFIIGGILFMALVLFTAYLLRPNRPNPEKTAVYECGEEPAGSAWGKFNIRFYVVALIFILFDVEIVFLFPWATVFAKRTLMEATGGEWGWYTLAEMMVFVIILAFGLAYAWRKGFISWDKPGIATGPAGENPLPGKYQGINIKYERHIIKEVKRD